MDGKKVGEEPRADLDWLPRTVDEIIHFKRKGLDKNCLEDWWGNPVEGTKVGISKCKLPIYEIVEVTLFLLIHPIRYMKSMLKHRRMNPRAHKTLYVITDGSRHAAIKPPSRSDHCC